MPAVVVVALAAGLGAAPANAQDLDPRIVVDELAFPTGIAFGNDGVMYVNERPGRIRLVDGDGLRDRPLAEVPTSTAGETGLLGIDVAPDGRSLFVFATDPNGASNRVLRVPTSGGEPELVVDGLPASVYHNGGGVAFARDGSLLISNGEIHESTAAQDPTVLGGKIYRFTTSGEAASGNPFGDAIALGLRNPYGMTVDPVTGDAFVTDNGPSSHDEVNRIEVGGNYGWPDVLGIAGDERPPGPGAYHDPVTVQEEIVVPTGIAIADPDTARDDFAGDLFYGTYGEQTIHRVRLNDARDSAISDDVFVTEDEPIIALEWGPSGLYYSTPTAIKVIRIAKPGGRGGGADGNEGPPIAEEAPPIAPDPGTDGRLIAAVAVVVLAVGTAIVIFSRR